MSIKRVFLNKIKIILSTYNVDVFLDVIYCVFQLHIYAFKTGNPINQMDKFRSSCKRLTFRTCSEADFHSRLL